MKIGVVSDGIYGERAFERIQNHFSTEWILLPFPSSPVVDEIEISIPSCDLYISYLRHPDFAMQLVRIGVPVLLGVNPGPGFILQAKEYNPSVIGPETMSSLIPTMDSGPMNEYGKVFGWPAFYLIMNGDRVIWCKPIRRSPCGSTDAAAKEINGQTLNQETLNRFALSICHNCRAPRFGKTCDREKAGIIHLKALISAVKGINPKLWEETCKMVEKITGI